MVLVELGSEMDTASWVATVVELNPGLDGSLLVEHGEGNLSLSDVDALVSTMSVEDLNVKLVGQVGDIEDGVLVLPLGVLATVVVNLGGPFLLTDVEMDEGVHFVKGATLVVLEVGRLEVHVDVTVTGLGEYDNNWHLKDIFFNDKCISDKI